MTDGLFRFALIGADDAQVVVGIAVVFVNFQGLQQQLFRFPDVTADGIE